MFPLTVIRKKLRKFLASVSTVGFVLLLMPGKAATGAEGIRGTHLPQLTAIGSSPDVVAQPVINTFQISKYEMSGSGAPPADPYTVQISGALLHRPGLLSDVRPSSQSFSDAYNKCADNHAFCDVVGISETYAPDDMILTLTVWSLPKDHVRIHPQIDSEKHPCDPRRWGGRDGCRALLFKMIVEELAGIDRDHKGVGK